ncbi:D-alanyl-D-alanine carboxypeptidase [Streptomyces bauhiniae]|uniref:D-alanyl-D-alanine carboxypeptidase n=1 Tax=Streptomyces bauhiniae TaxID=2340725 RepID=UPI00362FFDCF
MAGESPDRSKQHEDSVGSAGSGADEELREAVSAWVRPPSGGAAKAKSGASGAGSAGRGKVSANSGTSGDAAAAAVPDDTFKDSDGAGSAEGAGKGGASGSAEGAKDGDASGSAEGAQKGDPAGSTKGAKDGDASGSAQGVKKSDAVGSAQGAGKGGASGSVEGAQKGDPAGSTKGAKDGDAVGSAQGAKDSDAVGSAQGAGKGGVSGSAKGDVADTAEGASSGDAEGSVAPAGKGGAEGSGKGASVPAAVDGTEGAEKAASRSAGDSGKGTGSSAAVGSETDASAPAAKGDSESALGGAGKAAAEGASVPAAMTDGTPKRDSGGALKGADAPAAESDNAAKGGPESGANGAGNTATIPDAKGTPGSVEDATAAETDTAAESDSEAAAKGTGNTATIPDAKGTPGSAEDAPAAETDSVAKGAGTAVAAGAAVAAGKSDAESADEDDTEDAGKAASGSADDSGTGTGTPVAQGTSGSAKSTPAAKADSEAAPKSAALTGAKGADGDPEGTSGSAKSTPAAKAGSEAAPKGTPSPAEDAEGAGEHGADGAPEGSVKGTPLPAPRGDAKAAGKPVDTPTTALKSPAAKKPPVDQPTTMLKVGGKAKPAPSEQEAERTSKFVALKPDLKGPSPRVEETRAVPQVGPERTTQQPLPPKPPLDLLAELTNTPPPPETPVRTLVRRVKIWTPLVILLVVILGVVQAMRPLPQPTLALTAKDSFTFEGGKPDIPWPADGQAAMDVQGIGSFGSSGSGKPVPIASVAKVMTAYLILRDHPLKSGAEGPKISIDKAAQDQSKAGQESTVDVTQGDKITQREALEGVLIASANNVARLLARWDAGSEKAFVAKMNAAAKGLGMSGTTYTDPSGLTNSTVSTAVDQVKLAKAAMTQPAFREVAAMMSYTDYKGTYHSNWNQLVGHNNVVGIKTGTTTSALGNLVFAAKQDVGGETRMIIGAVLRQPPSKRDNSILSAAMDSSDALIRAGQGALKDETVLKKGTVVGYVDDGLGGHTPVEVTEDVKAAGWAGLKVKLSFTSGTIAHTAKAGTEVGSLTVGDGSSAGAVKVPVALRTDLAEPGLGAKLTRVG